jgi:hypothetical protein
MKFKDASAFFLATILVLFAAACRSSFDSSWFPGFSGCVGLGEKILGVDKILSKC